MLGRSQRTWPVLPQLRRRWLLGALLAGGLLGWLARADAASPTRATRRAASSAGRHPGKAAMPAALSPFIDHLIPADEFSPAASALGVAQGIWHDALATPDGRMLVERVCQWLDQYGEGFASLDDSEREVLVRWMSQAPWESPQRRFFHLVREQAFTLYYTQPAALRGFPFDRPPQPMGFALD